MYNIIYYACFFPQIGTPLQICIKKFLPVVMLLCVKNRFTRVFHLFNFYVIKKAVSQRYETAYNLCMI